MAVTPAELLRRQARKLFRNPQTRSDAAKLTVTTLEDRVVPAITGLVYQDYNANGSFDTASRINNDGDGTIRTASDAGLAGIFVTAFDAAGNAVGTTQSVGGGAYTLNVPVGGPYRVEFTGLPSGTTYYGPQGPGSGTAVQFVADANASNVNLGAVSAENYSQSNPLIFTNSYVYAGSSLNADGSPAATSPNANMPSIFGFRYSAGATEEGPSVSNGHENGLKEVTVAQSAVGTTWGLGYDKLHNRVLASAYTKRHTGYGPAGSGAIYTFNANATTDAAGRVTQPTASTFFVLPKEQTAGGPGSLEAIRAGYTTFEDYNRDGDNVGWDAVGKTAWGGLDLNEQSTEVYAINLFDRNLYVIGVNPDGTAGGFRKVPVPKPANATGNGEFGDVRPFAVQYYKGLVYVGMVNSAESTQNAADLRAYVYTFNPATNAWSLGSVVNESTIVNGISLNYDKLTSYAGPDRFLPWTSTFRNVNPGYGPLVNGNNGVKYPQPMLTGLAFDNAGNLSLGLRSRSSDQIGLNSFSDPNNPTFAVEGIGTGDLLKAFANQPGNPAAGWQLEANAASRVPGNPGLGSGPGNGQGPGGGEFYAQDGYSIVARASDGTSDTDHRDVVLGGVLQVPGFPHVLSTAFDPVRSDPASQGPLKTSGVRWFDSTTSTLEKSYLVRTNVAPEPGQPPNSFGKAGGIGDLIAVTGTPPIEIGNRIWRDENANGRQDPGEPTLAGISVELWGAGADGVAGNGDDVKLETAVTDAAGTYYFSNRPGPSDANHRYGIAGILPGKPYEVRVPLSQPGTRRLVPTVARNDASPNGFQRDSDAVNVGGVAVVSVQTGAPGQSDHSFDIGLVRRPGVALGNFVWNDANNNGSFDAGEQPLNGFTVNLYAADGTTLLGSTVTRDGGQYYFRDLDAGTYIVEVLVPAGSGFRSSTGALGKDTGPFEPGIGTNDDNQDHGTNITDTVVRTQVPVTLGEAGSPGNPDRDVLAGDANFRQDFGLFRPLSIGNLVYFDLNNSGFRDANEKGIAGVTVNLRGAAGGLVTSAVTNSQGGYLFSFLPEGQYRVEVVGSTVPAGFASSTGAPGKATGPFEPAPAGLNDNFDHGTTAGAVITSTLLTLAYDRQPLNEEATAGGIPTKALDRDSDLTQDFGFFKPLAVGDLVFNDVDNNGVLNGTERGIANVVVELLDRVGTVVGTAATDANGLYRFTNLSAGTYTVRITPPAGFASSTGVNGKKTGPFEPAPLNTTNSTDHGTTAGNLIAAATFELTDSGNPDEGGAANLRQDFGLFQPLALGDFVFEDVNNNGVLDSGEPPIGGVTVTLLDSTGAVVGSQSTNDRGNYLFTDLAPGAYTVSVTTPGGFVSSTGSLNPKAGPFEPGVNGTQNNQDHGTGNGPTTSTATLFGFGDAANPDNGGTANLRQDFGFFRPLAIGDFVFEDINNNGVLDSGEPGIGSVTVELRDAAGTVIATAVTNASGNYLFTGLAAGTYSVQIVPVAGYASSTGLNASKAGPFEPSPFSNLNNTDHGTDRGDRIRAENVALTPTGNPDNGGAANLRQDFGLYRPLSLGNLVFNDLDNNGVFGGKDVGLPNVIVRLRDANGNVVLTQRTGSDGRYLFTDLAPGTYSVEIESPRAELVSSTGTGDLKPTGPKSGPNEPGVPSSADRLDDIDRGTQSPTSVRIAAPSVTLGLPGTNPDSNGLANLRQDFGLYQPDVIVPPPVAVEAAQVSGYVFRDCFVQDGIRDRANGETGIAGVRVTLTGTELITQARVTRTAFTNLDGFYAFASLLPGSYTIVETQPNGFIDGIDTVGTLGGRKPANDTLTVTLKDKDDGQQYNFAEVEPAAIFGFVYEDVNRNRRKDAGEPGIAGVTITLSGTAFAGSPMARGVLPSDSIVGLTVQTDASGRYEFPFLSPGNYTIVETQPANYTDFFETNQEANPRPVDVGNDVFSNANAECGDTRGPLNFGEVRDRPIPREPGKSDFLGSSSDSGIGTTVTDPTPTPGVGTDVQDLNLNPKFGVTTGDVTKPALVVTAAGAGRAPLVRVFDYATSTEKFRFYAYEFGFTGGVRTATGDVNGDGTPDIITGIGVGGGPRLRVFSGVDGSPISDFFAYEPTFRGGLFVAAGDVNGDGRADIITGTEVGGGPRVSVFDGVTGAVIQNFFAFDENQRGGVRVAAADYNKDGIADIVCTTGVGVVTRVKVIDGKTGGTLADFTPYSDKFTGGVYVAAGDTNGDGTPDIIVGADAGGGPHVQVFSGLTGSVIASYFAYDPSFTGGVRVSATDVNGDGKADIVTAPGVGGVARVRIWSGGSLVELDSFAAFDSTYTGGVYVG